jgi:hypothetical protein
MYTISDFFKNIVLSAKQARVTNLATFINAANIVHKNKYDYSNSIYKTSNAKLVIRCPEHGNFNQTPSKHLAGQGCVPCGMRRRALKRTKSTAKFIQDAQEVHGEIYDYSKCNYVNSFTLVIIICNTHGKFEQFPSNHLRGHGCSKCSGNNKKTTEEFIVEANKVHNGLYEYTNTIYIQANEKVIISCRIHGDFKQTPHHHLNRGDGCINCSSIKPYTTETFIDASKKIHGETYNYDNTQYTKIFDNVLIGCTTHGIFEQQAHSHLSGYGCRECGLIKSGLARRTTQDDYVKRAAVLHNNLYTYDNVVYIKGTLPITITCSKHGNFEKIADLHLAGSGCPRCRPQYSKSQIEYLEFRRVRQPSIQHALNGGEHIIIDSNYKADGHCAEQNQVIEFHGCFWHGCQTCYIKSDINPVTKCSFEELYNKTRQKEAHIKYSGYLYHEIWECQWKRAIRAVRYIQQKWKSITK